MARLNYSTTGIQTVPTTAKVGAVLQLKRDSAELAPGQEIPVAYEPVQLEHITTGDLSNGQRSRLRGALRFVDPGATIKGVMSDNRQLIHYYGGNLYGVKRIKQGDITSMNTRTDAPPGNTYAALDGTGLTDFYSTTNQWITFFFAAKNVFKVIAKYQNDNWAVRRLVIGSSAKNLTSSSGTYTYEWTHANGWQSIGKVQFQDDGGRTYLRDLQILYANPTPPALQNGATLAPGDYFRVEGAAQLLRYDGLHAASGAWIAVPVSDNIQADSALDPISTAPIENQAVYWGLEALRLQLADLSIVEELTEWISNQMLVNELIQQQIADLQQQLNPVKPADLAAIAARVTALEAAVSANSQAIAAATAKIQTLAPRGIYVESPYAPQDTPLGNDPDWRLWLQQGIKNSRAYVALYARSTARGGAVLISESVGAVVATLNQDNTLTYTGIAGVNVRYTSTRAANGGYTVWITATQALVNNSVPWVAFDANGAEVDRGLVTAIAGDDHQFQPKIQTRSIRLEFDWQDTAIADDSYTYQVS